MNGPRCTQPDTSTLPARGTYPSVFPSVFQPAYANVDMFSLQGPVANASRYLTKMMSAPFEYRLSAKPTTFPAENGHSVGVNML
jgi:hypothetical protein